RRALLDELVVVFREKTHEVVPRGEMADERSRIDARKLLLAHRERDDRDVLGGDALVRELLVEGYVRVAVDRRYHGRLLAGRPEALDFGDDRLPVGMAERRVVDHDVRVGHALRLQVRLERSEERRVGREWRCR